MRKTKHKKTALPYQEIRRLIEIGFCFGMNKTNQSIIDVMNKAPCFLGSEKHLDLMALAIYNALMEIEVSK